jgi:hypothetical protein
VGEKLEGIGVVRTVALIAVVAANKAKTKDKAVRRGIFSLNNCWMSGKPRRDH